MLILIADDESLIRMGLATMLRELGHEVITAVNGREAIQMARKHQPDLAIFDIKMPYTDGLQAAKTLAKTNPLPIILLTAFDEQDIVEKATDLPIQGYLVKPVVEKRLKIAITLASKRFAESQQLAARAEQLAQTLAERKWIDRAKGKLMETGMNEEEAYLALQTYARDNHQTILDVAKSLLGAK